MKKWIYLFGFFVGVATTFANASDSDSEEELVLEAVNQLLVSINTNDLGLMARVTREDGINFILAEEEGGEYSVRSVAQAEFLDPEKKPRQKLYERIWEPQILVTDPVAVVWAKYDFHIDGQFSHCGVDVFSLIKDQGEWKVANMSWTVKKVGCEPSPLGPIGS